MCVVAVKVGKCDKRSGLMTGRKFLPVNCTVRCPPHAGIIRLVSTAARPAAARRDGSN